MLELDNLLPAVGNNEIKALTLMTMGDGNLYTDYDLRRKLDWRGRRGMFTQYCTHSLAPIGLVVKEVIDFDGNTWGWKISDLGEEEGLPLAGALSQWSLDHPRFSLYQMFGATSSHFPRTSDEESSHEKKRASKTRLQIFWELTTAPNNKVRLVDIETSSGEYSTLISQHIENMGRLKVVQYDSTKPGKSFAHYKLADVLPPEPPKPRRSSISLTNNVYKILLENRETFLSIEQINGELIKRDIRYRKYANLKPEVSGILSSLKKQGHAVTEKFGHGIQSEITFSDEQREAMSSITTLLDAFQRQDPRILLNGRLSAAAILSDQHLINILMDKALKNSPGMAAINSQEAYSLVTSVIGKYPNSTAEEIQKILEEEYNKSYSRNTLRALLREFASEKKLHREKTKRGYVYLSAITT